MTTLTRLNSDMGDILLTNLNSPAQDCTITMPVISGKSAYDLAVENGYVGSLQDWLSSLSGWQPVGSDFANYLEQHLQLSSLFNGVNSKIEANKAELDARIEERINEARAITTQLQNEAEARVVESKQLSQDLLNEAKNRINAIGELANDIQSESLIRTSEIEQLHESIQFEQVNRVAEIKSIKNITIDQDKSIASITTQLTAVGETLGTKASASALEDIVSEVTTVNGEIKAHSAKLVELTNEIEGKANSSALQSLSNTVTEVDGKVTTNSHAITDLKGSVTDIKTDLVKKADASVLVDYYKQVDADKAIAGKIEEFKSTYSETILPTDKDTSRINTWSRIVFSKKAPYIGDNVIPDYSYLVNHKKHSEDYFAEGNTMAVPVDNSISYYRAVFTVSSAKVIDLGNLTGDDAHAVYIDNVKVHSANSYSTNPCSFAVTAGEHIIDIIVNNGFGAAGFSSTNTLSSQVDSMYAVKLVYKSIELNATAISNTYTKAQADSVTASKIEELKSGYVDTELGKKFNASAITDYYTIAKANEAITNKIDSFNSSLVIGSRNLALGTDRVMNQYHWEVTTTLPLIQGKEYTISFDYIGNPTGWIFLNNSISKSYPAVSTSAWLRASVTFVFTKNDYGNHELHAHVYGASQLKNMKLELGNKATDWTPAPEDINQKIAETNANITNNYYTKALADEAVASQTKDIRTTVGNHTTSIQQHSESINGIKANWTLKLNANGRISGMTLMNDGRTSEFAIEADNFYVGAVDSAYKPFQVKTVGWTGVDGRSYPSGVYINNAVIGDLDAKVIRAGTITADKLAIGTPGNLINNFSRTKTGTGWYNYTGINPYTSFDGTNTPCMEIRTQWNVQVESDRFKVDPAKSYEFSVWLYSSGGNTTGRDYMGMFTYDSGGGTIISTAFDVNNPNSNWDEGNPYFWHRGHGENYRDKWVKYTGYVLAAGTDLSSIKGTLGQNVDRCFRFKSNTESMLFRILNFYNDGTTVNNLYMAHPTVREVDTNSLIETVNNKKATGNLYYPGTTMIDGGKIQTGSITADRIQIGSLDRDRLDKNFVSTVDTAYSTAGNVSTAVKNISNWDGVSNTLTVSRNNISGGKDLANLWTNQLFDPAFPQFASTSISIWGNRYVKELQGSKGLELRGRHNIGDWRTRFYVKPGEKYHISFIGYNYSGVGFYTGLWVTNGNNTSANLSEWSAYVPCNIVGETGGSWKLWEAVYTVPDNFDSSEPLAAVVHFFLDTFDYSPVHVVIGNLVVKKVISESGIDPQLVDRSKQAKQLVDDIVSDNKITPDEKQGLLVTYKQISNDNDMWRNQAYLLSLDYTRQWNATNTLLSTNRPYLGWVCRSDALNQTDTLNAGERTTLMNAITEYHAANQDLAMRVGSNLRTTGRDALSTANTANGAAAIAQNRADSAYNSANYLERYDVDLDSYKTTGKYFVRTATQGDTIPGTDNELKVWMYLVVDAANPDRVTQTAWHDQTADKVWTRLWVGYWQPWKRQTDTQHVKDLIGDPNVNTIAAGARDLLNRWKANGNGTLYIDDNHIAVDKIGANQIAAESITADKIDTRGLTIKDDNGKVILSAGDKLDISNVKGLGNFATVNRLDSSNISTYISGLGVKSLLVGDAQITNANIGEATIGTLQLRDQAVSVVTTIKVDLSYSTRVPFSGSTQAVYLDASGGMVKVDAFFIGAKCNGRVVISIVRDGNILPGYNIYSTGDTITLPFLTSGGYGNSAFSIYVSGSFEATGYVITATALKR